MSHILGFMGVEWAENAAFGASRRLGVVNCINKERKAKDVGEENEFLFPIQFR